MIDKRDIAIKKIEEIVEGFKVKPKKRGIEEIQFLKGSIDTGYRTALHCDCDNVKIKKDKDRSGFQLLYYPELFKNIMAQPEIKNIQVHWYWSKFEPKSNEVKITIDDFLNQNQAFELNSETSYRILRDKYF